MENEAFEKKEIAPIPVSATVQIEQSRAVQEVQAAYVIAKKFPRDVNAVYSKIIESCKRPMLADQSVYKYPRGGEIVTGPSIRLAEVLAQSYGNLDFGVREIERRNGSSIAESFCLDLETNTRQTKVFEVPHEIYTKKGVRKLSDPRDIYELVANNGARRLRACILGIIPGDIVDAAVKECKKTIAKGNGEPIGDRIRKMVLAFKELGVSQEMLEERLNHKMDLTTAEEIADITSIYNSLKDKQAKRGDFFKGFDEVQEKQETASVIDKIKTSAEVDQGEFGKFKETTVKK